MRKIVLLPLCVLEILASQGLQAHYHHNVYIVEAPVPVVVRPAPVIVQPAPVIVQAPAANVMMVESEPPAPLEEQMTACPGPEYAWVGGRWSWNGKWAWTNGYWGRKPYTTAMWVGGHWRRSHHDHRWVWEEGGWR
jgi:hypothetical protein